MQVGSLGALVVLGASDLLALDVDNASGLVGYELNTDGTIGALQETAAIPGGGDVTALVQYSVGAVDYLTVAHQDSGLIGTYVVNSNGSLSHVGSVAGNAGAMQTAAVGSNQYVVTANATEGEAVTGFPSLIRTCPDGAMVSVTIVAVAASDPALPLTVWVTVNRPNALKTW